MSGSIPGLPPLPRWNGGPLGFGKDVLRFLNERGARHHWTIRAAKWSALVGALGMAAAASTSDSDHGIRADGTKAPRDARELEGDPGGKPVDDVGQRKDAGEKSKPESDSNPLDESGAPMG